jgi:leucine dehydrogenase
MTDIFQLTSDYQFGEIYFKHCRQTGMKAIIAIHSTKRGPALGGCRFVHYANSEEAIIDALRLGQGMSYKAAMANLPLGGGKAVIIKPEEYFSREDYMQSFGDFVESLNGRYITALDSGTELSDMDIIANRTKYIASRSDIIGDPSPHTVDGVIEGIKAACDVKFGHQNFSHLSFAVQGLGHVGFGVAKYLSDHGAKLYLTDINQEKANFIAEDLNQTYVTPESIHQVECDVFVPCALGGIITPESIKELQCKIIAGAANNQLLTPNLAHLLHEQGILYIPDYIINSGGLIFAAGKYFNHSNQEIESQIKDIYQRVIDITQQSMKENVPPSIIVDFMAKEMVN